MTVQSHPISAFMKTYANFKIIFLIMVIWFLCSFIIEFQICIFNKMLLPKNGVSFEWLYYSSKYKKVCNDTELTI